MKFVRTEQNEIIQNFRNKLYKKLITPIDAMWEQLYVASSQHYLIEYNEANIGYCSIDEHGSLLQLYVEPEFLSRLDDIVNTLIKSEIIHSASLSSSEPMSFNTCLKYSKSTEVNTYCYEFGAKQVDIEKALDINLVNEEDIPNVKAFMKREIGFDDSFGYTENLVKRKELYLVKDSDMILATSELRNSDSQTNIADIGVIVNSDYSGKGIAAKVLKQQINRAIELGKKPICSTTLDNIASQKAISKAGFYCSNIIFNMNLK